MKEDDRFANSLLQVAKELEKANYVKKFKSEFEAEMSNVEMRDEKVKDDEATKEQEATKSEETLLRMDVYDDKEYDIEEVKFWNFISKNKGLKPSVVRTLVYRVPESSYAVRKCSIIVPAKKRATLITTTTTTTTTPGQAVVSSLNEQSSKSTNSNSEQNDETKRQKQPENGTCGAHSKAAMSDSKLPASRRVGRPRGSSNLIKLSKAQPNKGSPNSVTNKTLDEQGTENDVEHDENEANEHRPASEGDDVLQLQPIAAPFARVSPTNARSEIQRFVSTKYKMEDLILIDEDDDIIGYNEDDEENDDDEEEEEKTEPAIAVDNYKPKVVIEKCEEPTPTISVKQTKATRGRAPKKDKPNELAKTRVKRSKTGNENEADNDDEQEDDEQSRHSDRLRVTRSKSKLNHTHQSK